MESRSSLFGASLEPVYYCTCNSVSVREKPSRKNVKFMDVRRFSRAVTTMKCTKKRDARAVSRFYDDPVIVAVVLACATEETKPLIWLSPSANQRGNPCSGSHLLTRI